MDGRSGRRKDVQIHRKPIDEAAFSRRALREQVAPVREPAEVRDLAGGIGEDEKTGVGIRLVLGYRDKELAARLRDGIVGQKQRVVRRSGQGSRPRRPDLAVEGEFLRVILIHDQEFIELG